jgi:hypothetical protein
MTLSFSKFMITVDIRCTVCGRSEISGCLRLDDAVEWAEQHECAKLRAT